MSSSAEECEDVHEVNDAEECEDETKVHCSDKACETTRADVHVDHRDLAHLVDMIEKIQSDAPKMRERVLRLESGVALVVALVLMNICL